MNCAVHADQEAVGFCRNCGKALCQTCTRPVHGVIYCEDCLSSGMGHTQPPLEVHPPVAAQLPAQAASANPGLALFLGFIPGVGAVYNGEYMKALLHVIIFAGLVTADSSGRGQPFLGIMTGVFYFYMAIDSYRVASARRLGQAPVSPAATWMNDKAIGPIILIVLGVLFLLDQHFDIWDRIGDYWPLLLIALGVFMLWKRLGGRA